MREEFVPAADHLHGKFKFFATEAEAAKAGGGSFEFLTEDEMGLIIVTNTFLTHCGFQCICFRLAFHALATFSGR